MTGMTPTDIDLTTQAAELRLSPDGSMVAFTRRQCGLSRNNDYQSRIWLAPADGASPPYPFTAGAGRDSLPRWSPDGRRLAFAAQRDSRPQQDRAGLGFEYDGDRRSARNRRRTGDTGGHRGGRTVRAGMVTRRHPPGVRGSRSRRGALRHRG